MNERKHLIGVFVEFLYQERKLKPSCLVQKSISVSMELTTSLKTNVMYSFGAKANLIRICNV